MARFIQGANGTFSGKVGSVIGSSWRGIHYLRGLGKKSKKPASEDQELQRVRFRLLTGFLAPVQQVLSVGFGNDNAEMATAYSMALKRNMELGVVGDAVDNLALNYPQLTFSKGTLYPGTDQVLAVDNGQVAVSWNPAPNMFNGHATDLAYVLVYNVEQELFLAPDSMPTRLEGEASIAIPADYVGQQGHAWLFFASADRKKVSRTVYLGPVSF